MNHQKFEKLQQMVEMLFKKWLDLDFRAALFMEAFTNRSAVERMNKKGFRRGFETLRVALSESVIIAASALLYGRDSKELSLNNLIPDLLKKKGELHPYIRRQYVKAHTEDNDVYDALYETERFNRIIKQIASNYRVINQSKYKNLLSIRDKAFAHFEMKFIQNERKLHSPGDFPITYNEINSIVKKIGRLISGCSLLLTYKSFEPRDFSKVSRKDAAQFWKKL